MSKKTQSNLLLLIAAACWGSSFIAQKAGAVLQPFTYNGIRMFIGGLLLIPVMLSFRKKTSQSEKERGRRSILGGLACGVALAVASNLQQYGIYLDTDAGRAGFITSLYIIFVPVFGLVLGRKVPLKTWVCVGLGLAGFYLLTMAGGSGPAGLKLGDLLVLLSAMGYAVHIMVIDRFSAQCDGVLMSCVQFLTTGAVSLVMMALLEKPVLRDILDCWLPILYTSLFSCCVAFTLQIIAQRYAEPTAATLIMSTEAVFAVVFGVLVAHEQVMPLKALGCVIIFVAVVLAQYSPHFRNDP